jgi:hypothetical protein
MRFEKVYHTKFYANANARDGAEESVRKPQFAGVTNPVGIG